MTNRTLGSNLNVWNSCLRVLRASGYELSLEADDPDADLEECFWVARQGVTVLSASNPIELLGLAQLDRLASPGDAARGWWEVEGPDIYDELIDARWPE